MSLILFMVLSLVILYLGDKKMKDYEPQLEGLLGVFLQDFRETDSTKLELDKTMFTKLFQDDSFKTKVELLEKKKEEKIDTTMKTIHNKHITGIQSRNCIDSLEYVETLKMELEQALNNVEKDYWETFLSLIIKQNEQIQ